MEVSDIPISVRLKTLAYSAIVAVMLICLSHPALAQETLVSLNNSKQLNVIQSVLSSKLDTRSAVREQIKTASADETAELENNLAELNEEINALRQSFQQVAVGSVDLSIFNEETRHFDWRNEVTQIMMPIVQNLKSLTEKPRKIENLKSRITVSKNHFTVIDDALISINLQLISVNEDATRASLEKLKSSWSDKKSETEREMELATVQLENLQRGDISFGEAVKNNLFAFVKGRGLTLLLAAMAATAIWFFMRILSTLLSKRSKREDKNEYRTRQRLVHYSFKLVTFLLILIAVIVVFYVRGDVLLLGVAFLFAAAIILGLRNTIPKFLKETRVLLNLGAIREDERVTYNGLPYRVTSLNMFSVLRNPELTGVIRLPLEEVVTMVSRPAGKELWYPTSKGDYIVLDNARLMKVVDQTTELVELENLVGTKTTVPTPDFFNTTFDNLTRGEYFSVVGVFGIGYKHQAISNTEIPRRIQHAVHAALIKSETAEHVENVAVELKEAGASSLDYWVCVTMKSTAARSYNRILRSIQQTCVETCSSEGWDIPFPQLTLHRE
ncbi:MAG: hypothetical protein V3U65_02270 [Granulosicoccaceae bacterium]